MTSTSWIALIAIALVFFIICIIVRKKRSAVSSDEPINADSAQLYVGNLSYSLRDYQLKKVFSEFGEVSEFNTFDNQEHLYGLQIETEFDLKYIEYEISIAYLHGLTDASANHMFLWNMELEFN